MARSTAKQRIAKYALGGDSGDPLTPAEQKIADEYTKKGFVVDKVNGKLSFKKDPNFKVPTTTVAPSPTTTPTANPNIIPLPDYAKPNSRLAYASAFRSKYGKDVLKGYGDIPLRVNEKPVYSSDTSKNLAVKYANAVGINPALFYASSMIEGQSGMYSGSVKTDDGKDAWTGYTGDKDYPISGVWGFGLDSFQDYYPGLVKKGYLPKNFNTQWKNYDGPGSAPEGTTSPSGEESTMFKTTDAGIQAKAAMMRAFYDESDEYTKKKGYKLTPEQRDFFALAHFNSGNHGFEMLDSYNKAGLLKDNKFLEAIPNINVDYMHNGKKMSKEASQKLHKQIYGNVSPRLAAAKGLKSEGLFAMGGDAGQAGSMFSAKGTGWGMTGQMLPQIGDLLQTLITKPQQQSTQPIMNAQTAINMTSPYAFGGELDDIDNEQLMFYLQSMFNNQQEAETEDTDDYELPSEGVGEDSEDTEDEDTSEDTFAMGGKAKGIRINPKNKGKFNALKKKTGKSTEQLTHSKNPLTRKRAVFAQNAAKWKHAMGGYSYANGGMTDIEVEGDEVVQTPNGQMQQMDGPSHEQGGIDMTVPKGTKIYSDRLELEGKSMQQRKLSRENRLAKAAKVFEATPSDMLARNTFERTKEVVGREEQQDMALQKVANQIYSAPQQGKKAAYGDEVGDPWNDYMQTAYGSPITNVPFVPGANDSQLPNSGVPLGSSATGRGINVNTPVTGRTATDIGMQTPNDQSRFNVPNMPTGEASYTSAGGLTTGDYIGFGANLFNAVAPIINTRNAARATKPEVNRFQGFGKDALDANAKAQGFAGIQAANAKRDLDTATNSAVLRNRLGARSINTARALDTVTDINRNKAAGNIYGQYTNQMTGLLGQESQLSNQRDQVVMSGAQARDQREAQNTDNYYSNMAENLTNFGTNIGNIGSQLNKSKSNKDDANLLSQMSEYFDFARDKNGKLVLKNKGK